jgi:hypothetical protein
MDTDQANGFETFDAEDTTIPSSDNSTTTIESGVTSNREPLSKSSLMKSKSPCRTTLYCFYYSS